MNSFLFLLLLLPASVCQRQNPAIDAAIEKLSNKTWVLDNACLDDECYRNAGMDYHYFMKATNHYNSDYYRMGIAQETFLYTPDCFSDAAKVFHYPTSFSISFIDSDTHKYNTYAVRITGNGYEKTGELSFVSDNSFVLDPSYFGGKEQYKVVTTPKEIMEFVRRY